MFHLKPTRAAVLAAVVMASGAFGVALAPTQSDAARPHEIVITIEHLKALDRYDTFSKGDFYARVSIDGETQTTPVIRQQVEVAPYWVLRKLVTPGKHDVRMEIFDKDTSVDDPIDVNPLDKNRVLEAVVDTRKCRLTGYGRTYRCGMRAQVAGYERKSAEVTFKVDVRR